MILSRRLFALCSNSIRNEYPSHKNKWTYLGDHNILLKTLCVVWMNEDQKLERRQIQTAGWHAPPRPGAHGYQHYQHTLYRIGRAFVSIVDGSMDMDMDTGYGYMGMLKRLMSFVAKWLYYWIWSSWSSSHPTKSITNCVCIYLDSRSMSMS